MESDAVATRLKRGLAAMLNEKAAVRARSAVRNGLQDTLLKAYRLGERAELDVLAVLIEAAEDHREEELKQAMEDAIEWLLHNGSVQVEA